MANRQRGRNGTLVGAKLLAMLVFTGSVFAFAANDPPSTANDTSESEKKPSNTDLYGDPLPPGAVARLGSMQLRHFGLSELAFSGDGKMLISAGRDHVLRYWDVTSGKLARTTRLSGDPKAIAGWGNALSANGEFAAGLHGKMVMVWDAASGRELARLPAAKNWPQWLNLFFSPKGETLVIGSDILHYTVWQWRENKQRLLTAPVNRQFVQGGDSTWHACFSQDGKLLATNPSAQDPLSIWDVAAGKIVHTIDARASVSTFTPDGKFLAVATMAKDDRGAAVLRVFEVASGKEVRHISLPGKGFYWWIAFSPDRKIIVPVDTEGTYFLDYQTGRELRRLAVERKKGRQRMVLFSPDGRLVAGMGADHINLWDAASGKQLHERPGAVEQARAAAYSPDGRLLVAGHWMYAPLAVWDTGSGRLVRLLDTGSEHGCVRHLSFSAGRRILVVGRLYPPLEFLDTTTGKLQRKLSLNAAGEKKGAAGSLLGFDLSADGRRLTTVEEALGPNRVWRVRVWETDSAKQIARQDFPTSEQLQFPTSRQRGWAALAGKMALLTAEGIVIFDARSGKPSLRIPAAENGPLAASGDYRLLAALQRDEVGKSIGVRVWEIATGREVTSIPTGNVDFLALTRDGRALVTIAGAALRVWDLANTKVRHHIPLPQDYALSGFVCGLYLSPDDRRATTALADGTLVIWQLPPALPGSRARPLSDSELHRLWDDLAGNDAQKAHVAVWALSDRPREGLSFLTGHMRPVAPAAAEEVQKLIAGLDSGQFARRESAFRELEKLGPLAAPALRKVLQDNVPLELRRRVESLLEKLHGPVRQPEVLQSMRAVAILEHIATPEARRLLLALTRGAPEAPLTQEATAALERLEKRRPETNR